MPCKGFFGFFGCKNEGKDFAKYSFVVNKKVVLTKGFVKKTQKIPINEIDLAKKYRSDYLKRKDD